MIWGILGVFALLHLLHWRAMRVLSGSVVTLSQLLDDQNARLAAISQRVDAQSTRLDKQNLRIDGFDRRIVLLRDEVGVHEARLDALDRRRAK